MTLRVSRMYYRNNFFHIGHVKTLFDNDRIAKKNAGICYALIDDRQDLNRIKSIREDFEYLELKHIKVISVRQEHQNIINYTLNLIKEGHVYLYHCDEKITNIEKILKIVSSPKIHFQLRLNCGLGDLDPAIGYTNEEDTSSNLNIVLIFDYIIKVLDIILKVTDIITTSLTDVNDVKDNNISTFFDKLSNIKHHRLDTYHIHNFRYSKRGWDVDEHNPYLLTIKGLRARHVSPKILKAFYIHACQLGNIKIQFLSILINKYLFKHSEKALGVLKPVKINILNWNPKQTEYVCGPKNTNYSKDLKHYPLSDNIYIDTFDYGIELGKVNKGRTIPLNYGPSITCTDIQFSDSCELPIINATIDLCTPLNTKAKINWISAPWDDNPCQVRFYLYNWFYTGYNSLLEPEITEGYIDNSVFNNLDKVYQIENLGYFIYDRNLSIDLPTFIRICKI